MNQVDNDKSYDTAVKVISAAASLPIIKVDRQQFLTQQFGNSDQLTLILAKGPQAVYSVDELKQRAQILVKNSTNKTAFTSFVTGLPSNPVTMAFAGGADVVQYFGFALNLAQQIAYLFGEDEILNGNSANLSDEVKGRLIVYLGVMFGVGGAAATLNKVSKQTGSVLGKKVASQALTHTTWYPLIKQIGKIIGVKVTKKTVEKRLRKSFQLLVVSFQVG